MIGDRVERSLQPYLLPGERLLWSGAPVRGVRLAASDLLLIPFSLLWGGFALFWNVQVWRDDAPFFFRLWGLPFLAVGLYVTVGRFAVDAFLRARTAYGVSNRRVLLYRRPPFGRLRSYEIGHLPLLELVEDGKGRGTIRFDDDPWSNQWWAGRGGASWAPVSAGRAFDRIADPRPVYDLIVRETERWRREQYGDSPMHSLIG